MERLSKSENSFNCYSGININTYSYYQGVENIRLTFSVELVNKKLLIMKIVILACTRTTLFSTDGNLFIYVETTVLNGQNTK